MDEWERVKAEGAGHYKTLKVEPIDLLRSGGILHDFAIGNIIKYAFRSRKEGLDRRAVVSDMNKIVHYAQMIIAMHKEEE